MHYMNTEKTLRINCALLADTLKFGEVIGQACRGGEVFELLSDLGGGKTAFVRGLAIGIGTEDDVSSPSFTINNTYQGKNLTLQHFDFYRLEEAGVVADELEEDIRAPLTVVAVEWGDIVHDVLPDDRIKVRIIPEESELRVFEFSFPEGRDYLFLGVVQ
jgi:tRNA threonylcarbamoyladenosine biosynthesis protein TsaE